MIDTQYGITIMGGREVSRPYRFFSPKARGFLCFLFLPPLAPLYFSTEPKYNLGQYRVIGSGGKKWVGVLNN